MPILLIDATTPLLIAPGGGVLLIEDPQIGQETTRLLEDNTPRLLEDNTPRTLES